MPPQIVILRAQNARINPSHSAVCANCSAGFSTVNIKVVFAESCTAGMAAALLGAVPGISDSFCGSFVVYRAKSKQDWLGLPEALLSDPTRGTVCRNDSAPFARQRLQKTEEANLCSSYRAPWSWCCKRTRWDCVCGGVFSRGTGKIDMSESIDSLAPPAKMFTILKRVSDDNVKLHC